MASVYLKNLKISLFGESHSQIMGATLDGICPGIKIDFDKINKELNKRKACDTLSTDRHEMDDYKIVSGVFNGYTTGTPITILMENRDVDSSKYENIKNTPRPSHADYCNIVKSLGYNDYRGGGHSSGRLTAPLVAVGAICKQILSNKNIYIGSHIKKIHDIIDDEFDKNNYYEEIIKMNDESFPVLNQEKKQMMIETIKLAKSNFDSVGGEIETVVYNCPSGLGEPFFDSVESEVSSLLFSIPAVKGVSFGKGFAFSRFFGSEVNDSLYYDGEKVKTKTNNNGGINGGITNGMPIVINTVIKPTPSIGKEQDTIDLLKKENVKLKIEGRHDPCICHRSVVVIESMVAIAILNLYISREGRLSMK